MEGYPGAHRVSIEPPLSGCRSSLPTLSGACDGLCLAPLLSQQRASLLYVMTDSDLREVRLWSLFFSPLLITTPALSILAR
jgi:hypothetical protein